jgi:hypothetical protein
MRTASGPAGLAGVAPTRLIGMMDDATHDPSGLSGRGKQGIELERATSDIAFYKADAGEKADKRRLTQAGRALGRLDSELFVAGAQAFGTDDRHAGEAACSKGVRVVVLSANSAPSKCPLAHERGEVSKGRSAGWKAARRLNLQRVPSRQALPLPIWIRDWPEHLATTQVCNGMVPAIRRPRPLERR